MATSLITVYFEKVTKLLFSMSGTYITFTSNLFNILVVPWEMRTSTKRKKKYLQKLVCFKTISFLSQSHLKITIIKETLTIVKIKNVDIYFSQVKGQHLQHN